MQTRCGSKVARSSGATSRRRVLARRELVDRGLERWPASLVSVYIPSQSVPELCRCVGFSKPRAAMPSEQMWSSRVSAIIQP